LNELLRQYGPDLIERYNLVLRLLLAAALGGILIPLTLYRLGRDPAVASSPFVTTVTDIVGFFSFLAIATLWFGLK